MYVTRHVDWLSFSIKSSSDWRSVFPTFAFTFSGRGSHGYRAKYVNLATGMVIQTDSADTEMGHAFQLSGDVLSNLRRESGSDDTALSQRIVRVGGKASRIDLTINVHEGKLTPRAVQSAVKSGRAKAKAIASRFVEGKNGDIEGDTFYIGSPTSDRQFRAYNKSAELGIVDGASWLRLELELRRIRADGAFRSCALNGVDAAVAGHMADFLNWGDLEYQAALGQEAVQPVDIPRRDTNRQRWLLGQVAQALAKEICVDEDFALKFWSSVGEAVDLIKSGE